MLQNPLKRGTSPPTTLRAGQWPPASGDMSVIDFSSLLPTFSHCTGCCFRPSQNVKKHERSSRRGESLFASQHCTFGSATVKADSPQSLFMASLEMCIPGDPPLCFLDLGRCTSILMITGNSFLSPQHSSSLALTWAYRSVDWKTKQRPRNEGYGIRMLLGWYYKPGRK